jgi:hypothetical protein
MSLMRLSKINKHMAERCGQGTPHNAGVNLEKIGHEIKVNPPKILAHTKRKFGKARAEAQRKAILLEKARKAGAKIPKK